MQISWKAILADGEQQQDNTSYNEIDRDSLKAFVLMGEGKAVLSIPFKEGQGHRLIWRRRIEVAPGEGQKIVHIAGKKGGFVAAVFEDGSMIVDDNFSEDHAWLYPPEYMEFEKE